MWAAGVRECPGQLAWAGTAAAVAGVERTSSDGEGKVTEDEKKRKKSRGRGGEIDDKMMA